MPLEEHLIARAVEVEQQHPIIEYLHYEPPHLGTREDVETLVVAIPQLPATKQPLPEYETRSPVVAVLLVVHLSLRKVLEAPDKYP